MSELIALSTTHENETMPKLFLEVGTCDHFGRSEPGYRELPDGATVVTVDLPRKFGRADSAEASTEALKTTYESAASATHYPLFADGRKLPFTDNTFDTVLFNDVIGDPSTDETSMRRLVTEALRVVKVGGEVWVADDRASGDNIRAFEQAFPERSNANFIRTDDLLFAETWDTDSRDEISRAIELRDKMYAKVNSYDPNFYILKKIAESA